MTDHWHYPRAEFAARIHGLLVGGPARGLSLFGPRRTGKTQFLTHDLAPLFESKGHRAVYISFWQTLDSPLAILLYELDRAVRQRSFVRRMSSGSGLNMAPKFKLKAPFGLGELEVDFSALKGQAPESHLLLLDQYCEKLANPRKPTVLLLDEFQELARTTAAGPVVAALRTSLDKRRDGIVSVFTGSSQVALRSMFSTRDAPFYRFAAPIELPALDETFVDHQLSAMRHASKAIVDRATAISTFKRFNGNPMFFQRWLVCLALRPEMSATESIARVQNELAEDLGFPQQWLELNAGQRLVARLLAERIGQVYGQDATRHIETLSQKSPPVASQMQSALKRLVRLGHAEKTEDGWRLSDPLFEGWVRERPKTDF